MAHLKLLWALVFLSCLARAEEAPFKIQGHFDSYYQYSPQGHTPAVGTGAPVLEGRVFDNLHNQAVMNLVEVSLSKSFEELLARVDLAFGQQVDAMATNGTIDSTTGQPTGADLEPTRHVSQAYLAYTPSEIKDLTITIGKFHAYIGLEGFKAQDNWQYSRSFNYNYNPYWHQGLGLKYSLIPERLSVSLYFLNASDGRLAQEANKSPSLGASVSGKISDAWTVNYNYLGGKETNVPASRREVHELNSTYRLNSKWSFAFDYAYAKQTKVLTSGADGSWWVVDGYFKYQPTSWYYLSPRFEYVDDSDQGVGLSSFSSAGGAKQRIYGITITNSFQMKSGVEVRLEWRKDASNKDGYFKSENGVSSRTQQSFTVAALLNF